MDRDERLQLADELAGRAQGESRGELVLDEPRAGLLEPQPVRQHPLRRPDGGEDLGAEERQTGAAGGRGTDRVARRELGRARLGQPHCLECVHVAGLNGKGVAGEPAGDHGWVAQGAAQLRDLRLQGVGAHAGWVGPQVLDETLGAHRAAGVEREPHQQFGGQPARDRRGDTVAPRFDPSEHRDREHPGEPMPVSPSSAPRQRSRRCSSTWTGPVQTN
jgi:hypothetical protein